MSYVGKITAGGSTHLVGSTLYGTCDTAAATAAKVVTCANFDQLIEGVTIHVKFTNSNTVAKPTLNVNSTGAKNIYRYGTTSASTSTADSWNAGAVISFTYDGSYWIMNDYNVGNDTKVYQSSTTANADYRVLLSQVANDNAGSLNAYKNTNFKFNPSTQNLMVPKINSYVPSKEFILTNQSLSFSGNVATISDSRVTANTYCEVYFNDATLSAASNAGVVVDSAAGKITFTATTAPSMTLVCDIRCTNP